jgi:hypothetical protein
MARKLLPSVIEQADKESFLLSELQRRVDSVALD